ncbi:MAG: hypothetical protein C5B51_16385 [Terriglobia bacterium]|nr:MAG: hypothetical protein C5B51_16385 [Terriglobia bacterium]
MSPARLEQIEQLYRAALVREPAQREALLEEVCGDDEELKHQVEALLRDDPDGDDLLNGPATDLLDDLTMEPLAAGTQLGSYRIEGLLGAGGMGEVYLAHDLRLDRRVAIKILPTRLLDDAVARERLRREALAAAALDHPFICKIFEVGEHDGALFCVMEYVRGETLFARMGAGRMNLPEALRIAGEIAEAVAEAHANHFIHRDLKPGNIILTVQGHIKVLDFGLAKRIEPRAAGSDEVPLTGSGMVSGTPQYMSPEQAACGAVDQRSDLFSFGIILAELVTGRHLFRRNSPLETVAAILRDPPDLTTDSDVPPGLLVLIRRLLAKSPEDRYSTMCDVLADMAAMPLGQGGSAGAPRGGVRITLIGREQERARIMQSLDAAVAGHGSLLLISGEPGIGKTYLTRAILEEAVRRGCFTAIGHCYEAEGAPPYVPFIEMLEYGARTLPRDTFRHALGDAAPEVAKLMPQLRRIFPDIPPAIELPPEQQRRYLYNAYREFVERASKVTPLVAVFEDLHWADEPTLLLLRHLLQSLASMPVLLLGNYRDVELDVNRPFVRTLEFLLREKQATHLPLRRLPLAGTEELLATLSGQAPPPSAARIVFDHTEGNPFFVEEVFRHLSDEGRLFDQQGAWRQGLRSDQLQVPQGIRLVLGRRLERLPEEARRVLTTAAVIGRTFSLPLLEELESGRPDAALDAVDQAEQAHLVESENTDREPRYRFVHELIRQTLATAVSLPRRQRLHLRVADAIERVYASSVDAHAPALAHHRYQAGAAADKEKTVMWLARAGKQAAATAAFEEALGHLDNALSLLAGEQSARMAELHSERATVLRSLGRMPEAIVAFEQALALFTAAGEAGRFAEMCLPLVEIYWWTERLEEAREVCRRGLESLGSTLSPARIFLLYAVAGISALANDMDTAGLSLIDEVERLPVPPHPAVIRAAVRFQTYTNFICAQLEPAHQAGCKAERLSESAGDLWGQVDVAWIRALTAVNLGRIEEGVSIARQAIPISERVGHWGNAFFCEDILYNGRFARGDFECAAEAAAVLDRYERLHYVPWGVKFKVDLANVARVQGRMDEAIEWCRRAKTPVRNHWGGYAHAALALTLAQSGAPGVSQALEDALPFAPRAGHPAPYGRWPTLNLIIEALAIAGRNEEAAALYPVAEDMLALGYSIMWAGAALPRTTVGIAAALAGHWPRAEEHHQAAVRQADTLDLRVCQPISRYWYADMLLARDEAGDRARACGLLNEALVQCESLGTPLYFRLAGERLAGA